MHNNPDGSQAQQPLLKDEVLISTYEKQNETLFQILGADKPPLFTKEFAAKELAIQPQETPGLLKRIWFEKDETSKVYKLCGQGKWGGQNSKLAEISISLDMEEANRLMSLASKNRMEVFGKLSPAQEQPKISNIETYRKILEEAEKIFFEMLTDYSGKIVVEEAESEKGKRNSEVKKDTVPLDTIDIQIKPTEKIDKKELLNLLAETMELRVLFLNRNNNEISYVDISEVIKLLVDPEEIEKYFNNLGIGADVVGEKQHFENELKQMTKEYANGKANNWNKILETRKQNQLKTISEVINSIIEQIPMLANSPKTFEYVKESIDLDEDLAEQLVKEYDETSTISFETVFNILEGATELFEAKVLEKIKADYERQINILKIEFNKIIAAQTISKCIEWAQPPFSAPIDPNSQLDIDPNLIDQAIKFSFDSKEWDIDLVTYALNNTRFSDGTITNEIPKDKIVKLQRTREKLDKYLIQLTEQRNTDNFGAQFKEWVNKYSDGNINPDYYLSSLTSVLKTPWKTVVDKEYWQSLEKEIWKTTMAEWIKSNKEKLKTTVSDTLNKKGGAMDELKSHDKLIPKSTEIWFKWQHELKKILLEKSLDAQTDIDLLIDWSLKQKYPDSRLSTNTNEVAIDWEKDKELIEKLKVDHPRIWNIIFQTRNIAQSLNLGVDSNVVQWLKRISYQAKMSNYFGSDTFLTSEGVEWRENIEAKTKEITSQK
ncbi:hypothetical protein KA089_01255 [Candidatus Woesebacteria bacterium]|nr:hypothetical protein [Candidatus Woesebacteria bacterium]